MIKRLRFIIYTIYYFYLFIFNFFLKSLFTSLTAQDLYLWHTGYFLAVACGTYLPDEGWNSGAPPTLGALSLNHWTSREGPIFIYFIFGSTGSSLLQAGLLWLQCLGFPMQCLLLLQSMGCRVLGLSSCA